MTEAEINEAVARKLGWKDCIPGDSHGLVRPNTNAPCYDEINEIPDYCHDIKAAWEIWERLSDQGYDVQLFSSWDRRRILCFSARHKVSTERQVQEESVTAPMAICRAFLRLP